MCNGVNEVDGQIMWQLTIGREVMAMSMQDTNYSEHSNYSKCSNDSSHSEHSAQWEQRVIVLLERLEVLHIPAVDRIVAAIRNELQIRVFAAELEGLKHKLATDRLLTELEDLKSSNDGLIGRLTAHRLEREFWKRDGIHYEPLEPVWDDPAIESISEPIALTKTDLVAAKP